MPEPSALTQDFRALRAQLAAEGAFERDYLYEAGQLGSWVALFAAGLAMVHSASPAAQALAFLPLGLATCQAGWLSHDYIHGRGPLCAALRHFGGWTAGFSATMWCARF